MMMMPRIQRPVENGGVHLDPLAFHAALMVGSSSSSSSSGGRPHQDDDAALGAGDALPPIVIDVRNTFEHAIGRFETAAGAAAIEPGMKSFNEFAVFADRIAPECAGRKVLMYCTGGIRCEKASIMLKARGVDDVYQLSGRWKLHAGPPV